jgi:hypothetical protein
MAGFEPATSRVTVEVTHVFTTGKNTSVAKCKHTALVIQNYDGETGLRVEPLCDKR